MADAKISELDYNDTPGTDALIEITSDPDGTPTTESTAIGDLPFIAPGHDAADLGSGTATDGQVLTADGAGGAAWEAPSGGGAVQAFVAGRPVLPGWARASGSNINYDANVIVYFPIRVGSGTINKLHIIVNTLAEDGLARLGLYSATDEWQPDGAPLIDEEVATSTIGVKTGTPSSPVAVDPGDYLLALLPSVTVQLVSITGTPPDMILDGNTTAYQFMLWRRAFSYGSLPSSSHAWNNPGADSLAWCPMFVEFA